MSGVIIIGPAGIAFAISLPLGLGITSDPRATPAGEVSTIGIGPPLISAPNILPGLPSSCPSRSTKNIAEPIPITGATQDGDLSYSPNSFLNRTLIFSDIHFMWSIPPIRRATIGKTSKILSRQT